MLKPWWCFLGEWCHMFQVPSEAQMITVNITFKKYIYFKVTVFLGIEAVECPVCLWPSSPYPFSLPMTYSTYTLWRWWSHLEIRGRHPQNQRSLWAEISLSWREAELLNKATLRDPLELEHHQDSLWASRRHQIWVQETCVLSIALTLASQLCGIRQVT